MKKPGNDEKRPGENALPERLHVYIKANGEVILSALTPEAEHLLNRLGADTHVETA
jgi:hypothetical protein